MYRCIICYSKTTCQHELGLKTICKQDDIYTQLALEQGNKHFNWKTNLTSMRIAKGTWLA